ncbi:heterogeneous nuclear ribonucleoprotein K-like isoform X3 [Mizuhopecten yessoensis]|uniref:heterogeneous nuclear ribonucleoprotein K-like isoform X3 n=1 Tax=Mizuhopecten yessoensis TaxID=6573 RepID=UPI000B45F57E|nr:heterogeneous nuclear ribonucleoprotein K-like isoform X3 [Mizuhopecten yessoensis]
MEDDGNMKRPHEDDYQEDYDNKRRRGGEGQKIELRFLLASKNAGAIIGKGGSNIKRLRQDYKASVTVPDSTSPERVLTIGADIGTALDCALDIIPKLEDYKNYKDENFDCEMRLLVHQSQAGCIIGRAGFKIKELREKTGAQIKVYSQCCPQSTERVVAIGGKPKVVINCVDTIHQLLKTAPPKGPNQPYDPMYWEEFVVAEYGGYTSAEGGRGKGGPRGAPQASRGMGMGMGMRGGRPGMGMGMGDMGMGGRGSRGGGGMMGGRGGRGGMGGMRGSMGGMRGGGMGGPNRGGGRGGGFGGGMGSGGMGGGSGGGSSGGMGGNNISQSTMGGGGMGGNKQGTDYSTNQRYGGDGGYGDDNYGGDNSYDEGYDNSGGGSYGGGNTSGGHGCNFTQDNTGGMGQMFGENNSSSTQVTIPKDLAGAIIGKGGQRIQEIRRQSNAQVVIDEALPGSSDRIITITGNSDQIQNAQYLLQMRVKGLESSFH